MTTSDVAADLAPAGTLRAAINLGNPVLAQGTPDDPTGVTVDLSREVARRLDLPLEMTCFDAAGKSFEVIRTGLADLCFLAIEPAREKDVAFTAPYVVIEGVYAVPISSPIHSPADADSDGVRIGVKEGSAYDLFLARTVQRATLVRGADGIVAFGEHGLEVAAGIREPMTAHVAADDGLRLIEEPFMEIRQAMGTSHDKRAETVQWLRDLVDELVDSGFVARSLGRS